MILAALLLLIGVGGIAIIILVAARGNGRTNSRNAKKAEENGDINPWEEAGKRLNGDSDEPT